MSLKGGCEKGLALKQLNIVTLDKIPVTEEPEWTTISVMPDDTIGLEKGYYHGVYVLINFRKDCSFMGRIIRQICRQIQIRRIWRA